jgi:hypothetical protein
MLVQQRRDLLAGLGLAVVRGLAVPGGIHDAAVPDSRHGRFVFSGDARLDRADPHLRALWHLPLNELVGQELLRFGDVVDTERDGDLAL